MIPQNHKIDFTKCNNRSKGLDTAKCCYHKYGKDYPIKEYIKEFREGTNAKEIIRKAEGLKNLPHAMERIKDSEITIDMNEDVFTINRKIKLGQIAQRKYEKIQATKAELQKQAEAKKQEGGNE